MRVNRAALLAPAPLLFLAVLAVGAVPNLVSYQGALNDKNGVPVNGTMSLVFNIYDVPSGGIALWTENQSVPVSNGIFSVLLGSATQLPSSLFEKDLLYLGVKVAADAEMLPRQQVTSVFFAKRADTLTPPVVPIGGIVAWNKSMAGTPTLPAGWVECNGQTVSDPLSPYDGRAVPDLNGAGGMKRFLRGATASGSTGGADSHNHTAPVLQSNVGSGGGWHIWRPVNPMDASSNLPNYFEVVWIIRTR